MAFQLPPQSLTETAQTGAAFAQLFAPIILAADEARRPAMIESAGAHLRNSISVVTNALKVAGASDFQVREIHIISEIAYSDRLVELLNQAQPTNPTKES